VSDADPLPHPNTLADPDREFFPLAISYACSLSDIDLHTLLVAVYATCEYRATLPAAMYCAVPEERSVLLAASSESRNELQ
jgi:hypothetical protein